MATGIATFGPGTTSGIPISGTLGGGTLDLGVAGGYQDTAPTSDQYLNGQFAQPQVEGASTVAAPAPDPFARYGGEAAYNNLVSGFDTQKNNIYGTSRDAAQNAALARHSSILDFLDSLTSGQNAINERGVQNELGKKQGYSSIVDMVGRGLRSGGTLLSNRNALSSSAAEAIARAYGDIGRRENNKVNNGYELENRNIGMAQDDFNRQRGTGLRKFDESKQMSAGDIATQARDRLAQLDAAMVDADMPTRIAIDQERQNILNEVTGILSQFDAELTNGANGINPTSVEDRRRTAFGLANAGVAATNPFDFTSVVPTQFQNTGPFTSEFPLFSTTGTKKQTA